MAFDLDNDELRATRILNGILPKEELNHWQNCEDKLTDKNKYMSDMCMECKCGIDWDMNKYLNDMAQFKKVDNKQEQRIEVIRSSFSKMYDVININCKNNDETKSALKRLQEAQFLIIKGISNEDKI